MDSVMKPQSFPFEISSYRRYLSPSIGPCRKKAWHNDIPRIFGGLIVVVRGGDVILDTVSHPTSEEIVIMEEHAIYIS